ncbi:MAG: hypothetical protein LQ351_004630 [Letrouitia transgressa]|nr:MAG: hypothetical protein LQ351_004630 [Letrouitia transgressa]
MSNGDPEGGGTTGRLENDGNAEAEKGSNTLNDPEGFVQSSRSERSINELFNPPKYIALMRQHLFEVTDKIELQPHEFELYWPYVDNVWVRQHRAGKDRSGRCTTDYYACRLQRPTYTPKDPEKTRSDGKPSRKRQIREGGTCQMRVKTVQFRGGHNGVTITPIGDQTQHTHNLDHLDKVKRSTVLMEMARSEVMKGYMPASVYTVMSEDMEKLSAIGGRYLSPNDVRNASRPWRQTYQEQLRVHEGYRYDHGNGIVRMDGTVPLANMYQRVHSFDSALTYDASLPSDTLRFSLELRAFLEPYLPSKGRHLAIGGLPHVTLTYATSMDSSLSLTPGLQTVLSGPQSKAMTHYLRSRHDAILIGVRTALTDDPALNCRLEGMGGFGGWGWEGQPRPVVIDPNARWLLSAQSKILQTVHAGKGKAPWIIIGPGSSVDPNRIEMLNNYGGKFLGLAESDHNCRFQWETILKALASEGIKSVMVEGGGTIINDLFRPQNAGVINSVVVTIAPTYLGSGGVTVCPTRKQDASGRPQPALRFQNVKWQSLGEDIVMCGRLPPFSKPPLPAGKILNSQAQSNGQHTFRSPVT